MQKQVFKVREIVTHNYLIYAKSFKEAMKIAKERKGDCNEKLTYLVGNGEAKNPVSS